MNGVALELGLAVYAACVEFMLNLAAMLGVTYRDANALVLLVGFPAVTLGLICICIMQRLRLRSVMSASAVQG